MGKLLIICVETNKQSKTDWVYINETIHRFFTLTPDISIKPIYMGGKTNYDNKKVRKEIQNYTNKFKKNGKIFVVYFIDTDNIDVDPDRSREFNTINTYCEEKHYGFVWFCRDIEEVYWGKRVSDSDKLQYASQFRKKRVINTISKEKLENNTVHKYKSNILSVLSRFLDNEIIQ